MIIHQTKKIRSSDPAAFAWSNLRRFHNSDLLAKELIQIHKVPTKWHEDAKKQAQQIRYCLTQAREYFAAAKSVSLATKPNLLYYGTMSLALAEILFKQNGNSSLDKARAEHRHHGLSMTAGAFSKSALLNESAERLRASPVIIEGRRKGTFELWHRTTREHPLAGEFKSVHESGGTTSGFGSIMSAVDDPYRPLVGSGITLLECLKSLPLIVEHLETQEMPAHFVRGRVEREIRQGEKWRSTTALYFHPSNQTPALFESLKTDPNNHSRLDIHEVAMGRVLQIREDWIHHPVSVPLPPAAMINDKEWRMWTNSPPLNEFGYLYVALFIAGNYARYFPDKWLLDIESSSPLALAIEDLCLVSEWRAPWLTLCELGRCLLVLEA
jgi:hypothetical protein